MSNLLSDAGFELGIAGLWAYQGGASRSTLRPRTGAWSARIPGQASGFFGQGAVSQLLELVPGTTYDVSLWLDSQSAQGRALRCVIDPGDGNVVVLGSSALVSAYRLWEVGSFVAVGLAGSFRLVAAVGSPSSAVWFADDALVEPDVAVRRREIKDALLATLAGITVANGYQIEVRHVTGENENPKSGGVPLPMIRVLWSGQEEKFLGDSGPFPVEMHRKGSVCPFSIACYAMSEADADELVGHVEQILETQSGSQFIGLGYVRDVVVDAILDPELAGEQASDYFARFARVTVSYKHTRGQP